MSKWLMQRHSISKCENIFVNVYIQSDIVRMLEYMLQKKTNTIKCRFASPCVSLDMYCGGVSKECGGSHGRSGEGWDVCVSGDFEGTLVYINIHIYIYMTLYAHGVVKFGLV